MSNKNNDKKQKKEVYHYFRFLFCLEKDNFADILRNCNKITKKRKHSII